MRLQIAAELTLPLETVTQSIAILAKRRMGKSFTARRIIEQLAFARQQVVIVDPKGDWWGIRSSADGKTGGIPITILGGEHGDVPLEAGAGELVAKLVVEDRVSVLLDVSHFRKREVAIFMTAFMETLYRLKAQERYRTPLMLAIDEADAIAPQKPQPEEARMLGAAEDIVRRGGQRGLGCMLITQRSAVLNKNVLTQSEVLIALRTIAPQDRAALDAWFDVHGTVEERAELVQSLPSLPVGDAWVWSPGWPTAAGIFQRIHVLPIATFDSGATPKPGEKRTEPKQIADVDLEKLRGQMAATLERAKADDPKELRKRIAELEKELARPGTLAPLPKTVEKLVIRDVQLEQLAKLLERGRGLAEVLEKLVADARVVAGAPAGYVHIRRKSVAGSPVPSPAHQMVRAINGIAELVQKTERARILEKARPDGAKQLLPGGESVPPAQQRILDALAWLETIGIHEADKDQLAFLADQSPSSSSYQHNLGKLRSLQLLDYAGSRRALLLPGGRAIARATAAPRSDAELHEMICAKLPPAQQRILRVLLGHRTDAVSKADLAEIVAMSATSSSYQHHLGRMRSLGLIDYPANGLVCAQPVLFLEKS
jgi:hypothetical protein